MPHSPTLTSIFSSVPGTLKDTGATRKFLSNGSEAIAESHVDKCTSIELGDTCRRALQTCRGLLEKQRIHSTITMKSAGFQYTNNGDAARCDKCGLEVSGWTSDMIPFAIHSQRSPTCPFVLSILPSEETTTVPTIDLIQTTSASTDIEQTLKRLKTDTTVATLPPNTLVEVDTLKQVRKRTFSHWSHRSSPSSSQMIEAGFFNCNVGDRVICIYCNIICQQWTPNSDNPCEVHKTLSPKCPYVIAMLISSQTSSISIINEASISADPFRCHSIVYTAACNTNYIEIPKRYASFATWPNENLPPVDDLVRAGFSFTGTKTIVTCFYCNGSLQNWGPNDNPMIEHARWFPHCAYAKQLCGAELHRKIQESKRAQQERARTNASSNRFEVGAGNLSDERSLRSDEDSLSRLVASRLDLPISQSLFDRNFKLSIIERCWEDQLRLKYEGFVSDSDLLMACTILQKQIDYIDGKKENIIVPSVAMARIRERGLSEAHARELATSATLSTNSADSNDIEMTTSSTESYTIETSTRASVTTTGTIKNLTSTSTEVFVQNRTNNASHLDSCRLCLSKEWCPALLPCSHVRLRILRKHSLNHNKYNFKK